MGISDEDLERLRRCVELARSALDAGDEPFGSVLVSGDGRTLYEDRNRVKDGDQTQHPEFAIARWAVANLTPDERARATVYTSGEHCPMCAAGHAWVGLGPHRLRDVIGPAGAMAGRLGCAAVARRAAAHHDRRAGAGRRPDRWRPSKPR